MKIYLRTWGLLTSSRYEVPFMSKEGIMHLWCNLTSYCVFISVISFIMLYSRPYCDILIDFLNYFPRKPCLTSIEIRHRHDWRSLTAHTAILLRPKVLKTWSWKLAWGSSMYSDCGVMQSKIWLSNIRLANITFYFNNKLIW